MHIYINIYIQAHTHIQLKEGRLFHNEFIYTHVIMTIFNSIYILSSHCTGFCFVQLISNQLLSFIYIHVIVIVKMSPTYCKEANNYCIIKIFSIILCHHSFYITPYIYTFFFVSLQNIVQKFINISSPHSGSHVAYPSTSFGADNCQTYIVRLQRKKSFK